METIYTNIKTLFGKVKIDLIPNVSEFNTFILGYSEFAAIFGLKSPNRKDTLIQFRELKRANKYIAKQMFRLMKYAAAGEMAKHDYLVQILLTRSDACLVASIHHKAGKPTKGSTRVWYLDEWCKVVSLVNKTRKIARDQSCKLELKRVWIDKKLGDYARGLGVPKLHWRVHTFQENRIIENTLKAKGMLTSWQHGGRSFKGTHTAWEKIMFVLRDKPFIFEFDIKGFYDNIITKDIAPFLGEKMASRIQEIVNTTKPTEFKLPPEDKDKALIEYKAKIQAHWTGTTEKEAWIRSWTHWWFNVHLRNLARQGEGLTRIEEDKLLEDMKQIANVEWERSKKDYLDRLTLEDVYKPLMNDAPVNFSGRSSELVLRDYKEADFKDRAKGRESWKNLSQDGRGFPQGLSFSPILSTNALERALPEASEKNLTMYMDDGLIYGDSKAEVTQMINKLESALSELGINLAPEKSGWVRENFTFVKDSKFLGIKILDDGSLRSETRNGTSRPFPNPLPKEEYIEFCENLEINASTARITYDEILVPKGKEHIIWMGRVMGNILNYMYAPEADRNEQEWKIMEGRMKYCQRILRNKHKTLQKLERYFPEPITRPGLGEKLESIRTTSISSIASIRLLRYLREKRNRRVRA